MLKMKGLKDIFLKLVQLISFSLFLHQVIFRFSLFAVSKCFRFSDMLCGECVSGLIYLSSLFGHPLLLFDLWLKIKRLFSLTCGRQS